MTAPSLPAGDALSSTTTQLRRPRLGFLGVGWIGRDRMQCIARSGLAEVVAVCDRSMSVAREAAQLAQLGESAIASSLDALMDTGIDGLVVATPSALHAEQTIAALERGIAVFCQKPVARTGAETRRVVDAARANDRLLGVDLSYRHVYGMQRIRELVQSDELGEVYAADLVFHNAYGPDKPWFFDRALSGGGCVIDLGIHLVDLALWTLGHARVTSATSRLYFRGKPVRSAEDGVEDYAVARLDLDCGAIVQLTCSWNLSAGCDAVIGAAFYGTAGGAALHNVNGSFYEFVAERFEGTQRETLSAAPDDWGGRAAVEWVGHLSADAHYDADVEHLVDVADALDLIYVPCAS